MLSIYGRCARLVVALSALAAAGPLAAVSPAAGVAGYGDVADGEYFTKPVQWSVDNGVTGIDGACFGPQAPVSRGEAASYLWNMSGRPTAAAHGFVDVDASIGDAVSWLSAEEITNGTSSTEFSPEQTLTRAQIAAFLWRLDGSPEPASDHAFTDVHTGWQQDPVSWLSARRITTGTSDTTFSPEQTLNRAQLVTFLYRYNNTPTVTVDPATPSCADAPAGTFKTVSAGSSHSCAIRGDDTAVCWGANSSGKAADAPAGTFKTVSAGDSHSCGIRSDDTAVCWGDNWDGQADAPAGTFKAI